MEGGFDYDRKSDPCDVCGYNGAYIPRYMEIYGETVRLCPRCYIKKMDEIRRLIFS